MRLKHLIVALLAASTAVISQAQSHAGDAPVAKAANAESWEYGVFVQGGNGLTEDRNSFHFMMAGLHAGRVLTDQYGPGYLKGDFEYAVELMPFWQSYTPKFTRVNCFSVPTPGATLYSTSPYLYCTGPYSVGGTYTGVSAMPIILRWNLTHWQKIMPWFQGAGGVLWTNHKYPAFPTAGADINLNNDGPNADASVWNFTPQFGIGAHYFVAPHRSIDFSANAVHISSASLGDKNPGVNASVQFSVGYTWWK